MIWSFSFQLMPDEEIIDDSKRRKYTGIKPTYSVFLTNKRAIFHFEGLGSFLSQSFFYDEILEVKSAKRLFMNYLAVKTKKSEHLFQTGDTEYWMEKILGLKEIVKIPSGGTQRASSISPERKKRELLDMLTILRKNALLTQEELEEKVRILDAMKF